MKLTNYPDTLGIEGISFAAAQKLADKYKSELYLIKKQIPEKFLFDSYFEYEDENYCPINANKLEENLFKTHELQTKLNYLHRFIEDYVNYESKIYNLTYNDYIAVLYPNLASIDLYTRSKYMTFIGTPRTYTADQIYDKCIKDSFEQTLEKFKLQHSHLIAYQPVESVVDGRIKTTLPLIQSDEILKILEKCSDSTETIYINCNEKYVELEEEYRSILEEIEKEFKDIKQGLIEEFKTLKMVVPTNFNK